MGCTMKGTLSLKSDHDDDQLTWVTNSTESMYSSSSASHVPNFTLWAIALENVYLSKSHATPESLVIRYKFPFWMELLLENTMQIQKYIKINLKYMVLKIIFNNYY